MKRKQKPWRTLFAAVVSLALVITVVPLQQTAAAGITDYNLTGFSAGNTGGGLSARPTQQNIEKFIMPQNWRPH